MEENRVKGKIAFISGIPIARTFPFNQYHILGFLPSLLSLPGTVIP